VCVTFNQVCFWESSTSNVQFSKVASLRVQDKSTQFQWCGISLGYNRGIHTDVIVYIFAHLHTNLRTELRKHIAYKVTPGN